MKYEHQAPQTLYPGNYFSHVPQTLQACTELRQKKGDVQYDGQELLQKKLRVQCFM